ncbi:MAG: cyclic nucleotide-binding domain-containing protein [Burkholderiales bacterium]|nr:cyclic nucleotide-binding domain-containing protein [Burkholderiales bacterium]
MKTIEDLVTEHAAFRDLDAAQRALVAGCGRNRSFRDGEVLMREGEDANEFFAIRKGRVRLSVHLPERGETVIETLQEGEIVGLSWLFPPYKVRFDARAIGTVHTISFDGKCLRGKCDADPRLGYTLMKSFAGIMTSRLQSTRLRMLDVFGAPGGAAAD